MSRFLIRACFFLILSFSILQNAQASPPDSLRFKQLDEAIQRYLSTDPDTVRSLLDEQRRYLLKPELSREELVDLWPKVLNNHGVFFRRQAKLDSALHFFQLAFEAQDSSRNPSRMAIIYNNLANVHFQRGDYPLALDRHFQALSIRRSLADSGGICMSLGNIGLVYENLDEPEKARSYYGDALAIAEAKGSSSVTAWIYTSLGTLALSEGRFEEAKLHLQRSMVLKQAMEDLRGMGFSQTNLGAVYLQQYLEGKREADGDSAALYLERALAIHVDQNDGFGISATLNYLAELEMAFGRVDLALRHLKRADSIVRFRDLRQEQVRTLELESRARELQGDHRRALDLYKGFKALNDSLFNADRDREIGRKEAWSEYMHKLREDQLRFDHEMEMKEEERRQKNLLIAVIGLSFLLTLLVLAWLFSSWRATRRAKALAEEEVEALAEVNRQIEEKNQELQERIAEIVEKMENQTGSLPKNMEQLTKREMEVLLSLGLGLTDKEIAERLFISIATVRTHNRKIFEKLQIRSRSEAVGLVHKYQLLPQGHDHD